MKRHLKLVRAPVLATAIALFPRLQLAFRSGENQRCPGCGERHWHVGRSTAECAVCGFPLPIVSDGVLTETER